MHATIHDAYQNWTTGLYDLCVYSSFLADLCQEWRPLFNSERDGKSFNTFLGRAQASPGPTLLLVKDTAGHVFGGFAPLPWIKSGNFYGEFTTFIFRIEPTAQVRRWFRTMLRASVKLAQL